MTVTSPSPVDRFFAPPAERIAPARCDRTVPADAARVVSPLCDLVAAGVRMRALQRRWGAGERTEQVRGELAEATAYFDGCLADAEGVVP